MASFNYNLQAPYIKDEKGEKRLNAAKTRLYLWVIHDRGNTAKIKTEHLIFPNQWDFKKKRVKHQVSGSILINKKLDELISSIENEYYRLRTDFPSMKWPEITGNLKGFIKDDISPVYDEKYKSFFTVYDDFIEAKSNDLSTLTIKKYHTLRRSLLEFSPDITFDRIDSNFYDKYVQFLRRKSPTSRQKTREENEQHGLLNDTIGKYIENVKSFLRWSYEKGIHENNNYSKQWFRTNQKSKKQLQEGKKDIITLRIDEVFLLYNFDFSDKPRLERVRDLFCFMCFTLQRWSDAIQFDSKQVIKTQFGGEIVKAWNFRSYKTGKEITVPFVGDYLGKALEIAEKYNYSLPAISEQKFNKYVKEACEIAGINREKEFKRYVGQRAIIANKPLHEYVSSHTGRRTGISILLNVYHMPLHFVRDLSGHSDLKTLDLYLDKDPVALIGSLIKNTNGMGISPLKIAK